MAKEKLADPLKWWEHQEEIKGLRTIPEDNGFDRVDVFQDKLDGQPILLDYNLGHIPKSEYMNANTI
jgi:hypothetical protein|tara:strand:- start:705 stop:905 length:201 start_codon:yes stop_codon:yes gene_type:complete